MQIHMLFALIQHAYNSIPPLDTEPLKCGSEGSECDKASGHFKGHVAYKAQPPWVLVRWPVPM
ncbi:hypothetical protein BDV98DRAFT_574269 [Pterulicium gracile]|uniref:Uncharacterized protein n=1 Tax=Pterulicium gracile TaxID=1884261 RepID=A0A5C3Q8R5_9AGAR|nr:hypothetical protein BDV98DRAFT_574269 [Pterula gracilis]